MAEKVKLPAGNFSEPLEVIYRDAKADKIEKFAMIANFMWRRAYFMLKDVMESGVKIRVIDPCAGGGKLLSKSDKGFSITGYEPDYTMYYFAHNYLNQKGYEAEIINDCFESHFADVNPMGYHLAISVPYTDKIINGAYETDLEYQKIGNYALYVMSRSIDILLEKGIGVFCIPKEYVENHEYQHEIQQILKKADIMSVESYENYAIVVMKKI